MSPAVFDKLVPLLPFAAHVNLFASGEPTIARNIGVLLAEALRRRDPRAPLWISTNGKRVGREVFEILAGAENVWLQFSVDGGTPELFEAIRRGISFDELRRSLDEARRVRAGRAWPKLAFSSTISKRNVHDVAAIFELARDAGIDHVSFYEEDPEDPSEEAFVLDEADRPVFEAQQRRIDAAGVPYTNGLVFRGRGGLRAVEPPPPDDPPPLTCTAPWRVLHVRADGSVRTCCTLRRSMGDLGRQSLDEVWNGEAYVALRRAFVEQRGIPGTCYRCTDPLRTWQP